MSDNQTAIVRASPGELQRETTREVLDTIIRASRDQSVDVAKLKDLLDLQERLLADQRRTSFMAAMAELQAELPQITKAGTIQDRDGAVRNKYAKLEDIDVAIRPLCAKHGFSFSVDSEPVQGGVSFTCRMAHRDGHSETRRLVLPLDQGAGRNAVQSMGSTVSYARRYLLGMHLNLVTRDEDDDGKGGAAAVSGEQAANLRALIDETGANEERFLKWAGATSVEGVLASKYAAAVKLLEERRRQAR